MQKNISISSTVMINAEEKREVITLTHKVDGKYTYITDSNAPCTKEHVEAHTPEEALKNHDAMLTIAAMHE